jgi:beta-glucosidase
MTNRTYRYFTGKPLYAFGHGLSYTTFTYGKPELPQTEAESGDTLQVRVPVTNAGLRPGDEVVQVYVHAVKPPVPMPLQSLVGFQRGRINAGETKIITIPVKVESFRRWDEKASRYVVDPGTYELRFGTASDKILQTAFLKIHSNP